MSKRKKKGTPYTPRPKVPPEQMTRFAVMTEVIAGRMSVSEGARTLGVSRVHFQTLLHRAEEGIIAGLSPRPSGRPASSEREKELASEVERLQRELFRAEQRLQMAEDFLVVASELVHERKSRAQSRARAPKKRSTPSSGGSSNADSEPDRTTTKQASEEMRRAQADSLLRLRRTKAVAAVVVAMVVGVSEATARRRLRAEREAPASPRTGRPPRDVGFATRQSASEFVRAVPGIGAASLARATGLPRRTAAAIKRATLTELERERKAAMGSVRVAVPGVLRGFDAMHAEISGERQYLLVSGDGAVPYRTQTELVERYDSEHVAAHLDRDFAAHGAPLVLRYDRASCHRTAEVLDVLACHQVLPLHGPPHHPRYYGQLERQNREHRPYLDALADARLDEARIALEDMRFALNDLYPRPSLAGRTAGALWTERPRLSDDRSVLRDEVTELAARIERDQELEHSIAWRFAVENALSKRGYLIIERRAEVLSGFNGDN
jgi:transposase